MRAVVAVVALGRSSRRVLFAASAAIVVASVVAAAQATVTPRAAASVNGSSVCRSRTERVNVGSDGKQTNAPVLRAAVSANGRFVAFSSSAPNLVPGDHNRNVDVFVRDLRTGTTTRVSVSSAGREGNGASFFPSISANGRVVAFRSFAKNLVDGDHNNVEDVFVHDRVTNRTERVSVGTGGREGNGASFTSSISADGSVVAFTSLASNLVPGDRNKSADVFVRDRTHHRTVRVSVGASGEAAGTSEGSGISASGHAVVFRSLASNLVHGDTNGLPDVFVRDWVAATTRRVDISSTGAQANNETYRGSISGDGRRVAFRSDASNLVPGDTNDAQDVFEYDLPTRTMTRISVSTRGAQAYAPPSRRTGPGHSLMTRAFLSATGRYAAFGSHAANLVPHDTNGVGDVFLHDLVKRRTVRVSVGRGGAQSNGESFVMGISGDGSVVAFVSSATNLVPGDTNALRDAFVRIDPLGCSARAR